MKNLKELLQKVENTTNEEEKLNLVKEHYKLEQEEHDKIGEQIQKIMLHDKFPVENPQAIIDIAPPASGKTGLNDYGKSKFLDNNVVIIDYKTYSIDIKLNYLPYGLSMQLPVYLYLTKNYDKDIETIGFYIQEILNNSKYNKKVGTTLKEQQKDSLKLKGYTIGNESKISIFDTTYEKSEMIYGMKLSSKGFDRYAKVLTEKQINNIIKLTDNKINECINNIENANFEINPKMILGKNIGCEHCKYKDICFMTNRDIKDLEFLEQLE